MSLTLINTTSSTTANSYVSLATAGLYIEENIHVSSTWASLSTSDREASLIYATSLLDTQVSWMGLKASSTQALEWPRTDCYDRNEYSVDDASIPAEIQRATSFYAYFLSQENRVDEDDTFGFKSLKAGSLAMVIDKYDRKETMPNTVWDMIKWYGTISGGMARTLKRK